MALKFVAGLAARKAHAPKVEIDRDSYPQAKLQLKSKP